MSNTNELNVSQENILQDENMLDLENRCLPTGWTASLTQNNIFYYNNNSTGESQWVRPNGSLPVNTFGDAIQDISMIINGRLYNVSNRFLLSTGNDVNGYNFIDIDMPENPEKLYDINIKKFRPIDTTNSDPSVANVNKKFSARLLLKSKLLGYNEENDISKVTESSYYTLSDDGTPKKSNDKKKFVLPGPYYFRKAQSMFGFTQPTTASNIELGSFNPTKTKELSNYFTKNFTKK